MWSIPYSFGLNLKAACLLSIQRTTNTLEKLHLDGYFGGMNSQEKRGMEGGDVFGQNSSSFFLLSFSFCLEIVNILLPQSRRYGGRV